MYEAEADLPIGIDADEKRLRQVLINLLGNAIKFTDEGYVKFVVKAHRLEPETASSQATYKLRFQIEDTGVGMTPEQLETIFLPFEQVGSIRKKSEGTGLGLAITLKIVSMMCTTLELTSELNKGSMFWFDIEVPEAHDWVASSITSQNGKIIGFVGSKKTILVADDRWENRSVLTNLLEPIGFNMIIAENGQEGLEKALERCPDLLITDISMSLLDGYELMTKLRSSDDEKLSSIPIIVSSASVFEADRYKSFEAGANEFVAKQVQAEALMGALQRQLDLEWLYDSNSECVRPENSSSVEATEIVLPSKEDISKLYDLSRRGLVPMLVKEVEAIRETQPKCEGFTQPLLKYAKGFQLKQIREFLEQYIDGDADR